MGSMELIISAQLAYKMMDYSVVRRLDDRSNMVLLCSYNGSRLVDWLSSGIQSLQNPIWMAPTGITSKRARSKTRGSEVELLLGIYNYTHIPAHQHYMPKCGE